MLICAYLASMLPGYAAQRAFAIAFRIGKGCTKKTALVSLQAFVMRPMIGAEPIPASSSSSA